MMNRTASVALVALAASAAVAHAEVAYSNIPGTLADNYASLGYQATSTAEFGDRISFGGTNRDLDSVTVTLSSWARSEDFGGATSYEHDLTFNIYAAGTGDTPGTLLGSVTQTQTILYRPTGYSANGIAFNVSFDFSSLSLTLPDDVVFGLAFNTMTHGYDPIGSSGPYNSLNFALNDAPGGGITVGSNADLDDAFWNTSNSGFYTDGGTAGVGIFRRDTNWDGYAPMVQFDMIPAPGSVAVLAAGGLLASRRRRA